jgi:hypothetical protein
MAFTSALLYTSPVSAVTKGADVCVDENASGLNDATDIVAIETRLGQMSLPGFSRAELGTWVPGSCS